MTVTLASDNSISLDSLYIERTYAGLLEGFPTSEMNARILADAASKMTPLWGARATHVIPPVTIQIRGRTIFPELMYFAWLSSNTPIKPEFMGSELVVVWFASERVDVPISTIVSEALRDLPWARLAQDFDW